MVTKVHPFIPAVQSTMYLNGGLDEKKRKLHDDRLTWENGNIRCTLCNIFIKNARTMHQHCEGKKHIKRKKVSADKEGVAVCQTALENFDSTKKLGTLAPKVQEYRCSAIIAAAKSNTPISEIIEIGRSWVDKYSGYSLGSRTDMVTTFSKPILNSLIQRIRSILCGGGCFPEYSVTFDRTP